jgi:uncharacterized caspase-like protein
MSSARPFCAVLSCAVGTFSAFFVLDAPRAQPADTKRFEIVDCVMPSAARKRGRNFSEIVRGGVQTTSAEECENFGGTFVPVTSLEASLEVWRPEAQRGDASAQYRMGSIIEQGPRGRSDVNAAIEWYTKANAQGDLRARASLIRLAQEGKWKPPADQLGQLMGQGFGSGLEPMRAERDTLRTQLDTAQAALRDAETQLRDGKSRGSGGDPGAVNALTAEVQRLREVNDTYRQRMSVVEKVSDRLRLELGAAPAGKNTGVAAGASALASVALSIEIFEPPVPTTRGLKVPVTPARDGQLRVVGRASSPAGIRTLTVNSKPHSVSSEGTFEIRTPVTRGATKFVIKATDGANRTQETEFELVAAASAPQSAGGAEISRDKLGNFHALVIGNNNYTKGWAPLQTAVGDAQRMGELLQKRYGFQVKTLINADRYAMMSALSAMRQSLTANDNLLIFYAGHGEIDKSTGLAYWVPVDGETRSQANWISALDVTNTLLAMKAKNILLVADSCYSGAFTYRTIPNVNEQASAAERASALSAMGARKSRTILTSGGNEPVLDSSDGKHSLFAAELFPLLENNRQPLEASRIFKALAVRVHDAAKKTTQGAVSSEYSNQVPYYAALDHAGHELGDFVFVPR